MHEYHRILKELDESKPSESGSIRDPNLDFINNPPGNLSV